MLADSHPVTQAPCWLVSFSHPLIQSSQQTCEEGTVLLIFPMRKQRHSPDHTYGRQKAELEWVLRLSWNGCWPQLAFSQSDRDIPQIRWLPPHFNPVRQQGPKAGEVEQTAQSSWDSNGQVRCDLLCQKATLPQGAP